MKERLILLAISAAATLSLSCHAMLDAELRNVCASFRTTLKRIPGARVETWTGRFKAYDDIVHYGCMTSLHGDSSKNNGLFNPTAMFSPIEDSDLYRAGWRHDCCDADGPDGTAFGVAKGNIICYVEGSWDGGEDGNPTYIPSSLYNASVKCWLKGQ